MYGFAHYCRRSSGLFNSTRFIVEGLVDRDVDARIIEVDDHNQIDREVTAAYEYDEDGQRLPMLVVIEALWVTPAKFQVLLRLHPKIRWSIHLHSNMPFLAMEGISMEWIIECSRLGVGIIANSEESYKALRCVLEDDSIIFLPNVYISDPLPPVVPDHDWPYIDIGCFGAVRPLKNQLVQALASIRFAREIGKRLRFHINATRVEMGGLPVKKNLVALFERTDDAVLVENDWHDSTEGRFIDILHNSIDISLQNSLSETFNVVSADAVTAGLPIVVSSEVKWASGWNKADMHDVDDMVKVMHRVFHNRLLIKWNQWLLLKNSQVAQSAWYGWVRGWT